MAELTPRERLQPALLDRLTDAAPEQHQEAREQRVISMRRLRECVLRDLAWLFNAGNHSRAGSLEDYPLVARSVLNYGLPELSGRIASSLDVGDLERALRQAIYDFEPRILRQTVRVRAVAAEDPLHRHNKLVFEIEGELWGQPVPEHLFVKTEVDLESGQVRVSDGSGAPVS